MSEQSDQIRFRAFFFDFDGVLADSVEVKTTAFARLYRPYGADVTAKVVDHHRRHGGMTRVEKFKYYHEVFLGTPLSKEGLRNICSEFSRLVVDQVVEAREIPGAGVFLRRFYRKHSCFVVSATPVDEIWEIVKRRNLDRYFKEVAGAPATKQDILGLLLDRYSLEPAKCLFFGDAESDYKAAKACGVNFVGILPGPEAPLLKTAPEIIWMRNFFDVQLWMDSNGP